MNNQSILIIGGTGSLGKEIVNRYLENNIINAYDECYNIWNDTYPSGGNYWDDYSGVDENDDGIGDTPYNISGASNQDCYPLIHPWNGTEPTPNCGDANADGVIDVGDVVYLINYLFRAGSEPEPMLCVGDVTADGEVNIGDVVYLTNYLFRGGPPPGGCCQ